MGTQLSFIAPRQVELEAYPHPPLERARLLLVQALYHWHWHELEQEAPHGVVAVEVSEVLQAAEVLGPQRVVDAGDGRVIGGMGGPEHSILTSSVRVPLPQLFTAFLYVGLTAFGGGGTAHIYQLMVVQRGWLSEREFLETTALCRVLPGPVFANLAAHLGARLGGVAALAGVLLPGVSLMLSLAYFRFGALPGSSAEGALSGVAAAAIGLILATVLRQARIGLDSLKAVLLALVVFVTYGLLHWSLLLVLLLTVPVMLGGGCWACRSACCGGSTSLETVVKVCCV